MNDGEVRGSVCECVDGEGGVDFSEDEGEV